MPRHTVYVQTVVQALTAEGDQERNVAVYINGGQEVNRRYAGHTTDDKRYMPEAATPHAALLTSE